MDWTKSYSASWRVFRVNEATWADSEQLSGVDAVNITRSCSGDCPRLESGSMTVTGNSFEQGYYRIVMYATQGVETERVDVATLLCESSKDSHDYGVSQFGVSCNSVLYPAYTERVLDGAYIAAGANVAEFAADMLRRCIKAPVEVDGGFALADFYWFDFGIRILDAVWEALNLGGYVMQIDGRGTVHIMPRPTEAALSLDGANVSLLSTKVQSELNAADVPNRYIAKSDLTIAVAVNDSPDSPVSTVSRGYYYDEIDDSPAQVDGETLAMYALRRLSELSTAVTEVRSYQREYIPDVLPFDLVTGTLGTIGVTGDMRVINQTLECAEGITVSEQLAREVQLWQQI